MADHLILVSIYVHLGLRCLVEGSLPALFLLAFAAGMSHALQGAAADYYRSGYLYFVKGARTVGFVLRSARGVSTSWRDEPWNKLLLALYLNFTRQQEMLAPRLKRLRDIVREFHGEIPVRLRTRYRDFARPMLKGWRLLMTNTRMLVLFLSVYWPACLLLLV